MRNLLLVLALCFSIPLFAQWQPVYPLHDGFTGVWFTSRTVGYVTGVTNGGQPLIYKTVNGGRWKKLLVDGRYNEEYSNLTRHRDGSLYLNAKWSTVFRSADNGDTWQRLSISYQYLNSPVSDIETDPAGNLIFASNEGLVSVLSPQTLSGSAVSFYTPETHFSCVVYNLHWEQNQLYFLVIGNTKPGLYTGTNGSYRQLHAEFPERIESYFVKKDGTVLLATGNSIYYYNN